MYVITIENFHIYSRVCTTFVYCLKYVYIFLCQISIVTHKFEDFKGLLKSRISKKDRQFSGQKKKKQKSTNH